MISFGIKNLDEAIGGGILPGEICAIVGKSKTSKMTLALNAAVNFKPVTIFSGEGGLLFRRNFFKQSGDGCGLGIYKDAYVAELAALAIKNNPELIIIDELQRQATPDSLENLGDELKKIMAAGKPVIITSTTRRDGTTFGLDLLNELAAVVLELRKSGTDEITCEVIKSRRAACPVEVALKFNAAKKSFICESERD